MAQILSIKKSDIVLDVGHGSGRVVLQLAATSCCQEVRGIEIMEERDDIAKLFKSRLLAYFKELDKFCPMVIKDFLHCRLHF